MVFGEVLCSPLVRLQMILGIMEQRKGEGCEEYLKSANEKAGLLATLVNELLLFSKASLGDSAKQLSQVDLNDAVADAIHREEASSAQIETEIPSALAVQADPELLVRALSNLIRNSIRYAGEAGPIRVSASQEDERVIISVSDQGPGVPEAELGKIFDAFYRLDSARTRETGGTGLGLTIVKTCIESCGGSVQARNRQPHGLEVLLSLSQS